MTKPICEWIFDPDGNLTIRIKAENVAAFGKWINDEYGNDEPEMYDLIDVCVRKEGESMDG